MEIKLQPSNREKKWENSKSFCCRYLKFGFKNDTTNTS